MSPFNPLSKVALLAAVLTLLPACVGTNDAGTPTTDNVAAANAPVATVVKKTPATPIATPTAPATPAKVTTAAPAKAAPPVAVGKPAAVTAAPPAAVAPAPKPVVQDPDAPKVESRNKFGWWKTRQAEVNEIAQDGGFDVMFIGDSITHNWEKAPPEKGGLRVWNEKLAPFRPANFGFSGDQTGHVLWRLRHGNLDGKADPKLAVVMIGTNDTGSGASVQRTVNGIRAILDELQARKPKTKILLLAIFPRDAQPTTVRRLKNEEINARIAKFADNKTVFFKDINKGFLDDKGVLHKAVMGDFLHPGEAGYHTWADAIIPDIKALLGKGYVPAPTIKTILSAPAADTPKAESKTAEKWWAKRQRLLNERARAGGFDVMFVGDSITHFWENSPKKKGGIRVWNEKLAPFRPANFGIGADQTGNVRWRLQHGNLDGKADPKLVVVMIGTNDTGFSGGNVRAQRTANGVKAILNEIQARKPAAKILLLAIFPRDEQPTAKQRLKNEEINALLAKFADNKTVFFKDINKAFLDDAGVLHKAVMDDFLHPGEAGYHTWADAIIPDIKALLGPDYVPAAVAK